MRLAIALCLVVAGCSSATNEGPPPADTGPIVAEDAGDARAEEDAAPQPDAGDAASDAPVDSGPPLGRACILPAPGDGRICPDDLICRFGETPYITPSMDRRCTMSCAGADLTKIDPILEGKCKDMGGKCGYPAPNQFAICVPK